MGAALRSRRDCETCVAKFKSSATSNLEKARRISVRSQMVQRDVQRMVQGGAYWVVAAVAEILWEIQALGHFKFGKCGKEVLR